MTRAAPGAGKSVVLVKPGTDGKGCYRLRPRARIVRCPDASMACFSFIEGWYSPVRLHSALGYRSPMACTARGFWDTELNPTPPWRPVESACDGTALA